MIQHLPCSTLFQLWSQPEEKTRHRIHHIEDGETQDTPGNDRRNNPRSCNPRERATWSETHDCVQVTRVSRKAAFPKNETRRGGNGTNTPKGQIILIRRGHPSRNQTKEVPIPDKVHKTSFAWILVLILDEGWTLVFGNIP